MVRRLRIAASVFFAIVTVALVALWVRSYITEDVISAGGPRFSRCMQSVSSKGKAKIMFYTASPNKAYWEWSRMPFAGRLTDDSSNPYGGPAIPENFSFTNSNGTFALIAPYWLYAVLMAGLTAFPCIHWTNRFSLRTMLIATTLFAVILGAAVLTFR